MNAPVRSFDAKPAVRGDDPLLIAMIGPPGGGKTFSALRVASGIKRVRGGDIVVIDTEGGRAKKYAGEFDFLHVPFDPPFKPTDYLAAIRQQVARNPAAIIIDSASDEHEGEGGVLDWHDRELDRMAGDDWGKRERMTQAAWIKPKRDRISLTNGLMRITVPMIFCFRAREKTKQIANDRGKMVPTNIGYMPIAPSELVGAMDLTCILPPRAEGVPVWKSDKAGEDFIIKLPNYLKPFIQDGKPMSEDMGAAFATWAKGGATTTQQKPTDDRAAASVAPSDTPHPQDGAADQSAEQYCAHWRTIIASASNAEQLGKAWNADKATRDAIEWPDDGSFAAIKNEVMRAVDFLKK